MKPRKHDSSNKALEPTTCALFLLHDTAEPHSVDTSM